MKIIIATGIYPPDIGGHSFYAKELKEALERMGHEVRVVMYGNLKKLPTGVRHLCYAVKLFFASRKADAVVGFDTFSVAVPLGLIAPLLRIPVLERAGGDFVWEEYIERTDDAIPLPQFYAHPYRWNAKERISFRLIRFAMRRLDVVFSSQWQQELWKEPYGFKDEKTHVIENALPPRIAPLPPAKKNFLFYGRQIKLKNAERFHRAFAQAKETCPDITLEEGSIDHDALMEKVRSCYAVVVPSISEVTPHAVLEALCRGKPVLLTKYSGYAERFAPFCVLVDPLDEADMARGIEALATDATYRVRTERIAQEFTEVRTYDDIAREFLALIEKRV